MKYIAKKMGELAYKVPDAVFETWDGKVVRATPQHCWAIGHDISSIVKWAEKNQWMLKITDMLHTPPMTEHKVEVRKNLHFIK